MTDYAALPPEIMAELRRIVQCSGPFEDLARLKELWRAAFPEDVVACIHTVTCARGDISNYWCHAGPHAFEEEQ